MTCFHFTTGAEVGSKACGASGAGLTELEYRTALSRFAIKSSTPRTTSRSWTAISLSRVPAQ